MTIIHSQEIWFFINRTLKVTVERQRPKFHYTKDPSTSDTSSFPSGHAGQAFVMAFAADFLFEMPLWTKISMYSLATTSSLLRVAADRHFFTDTVVGAGIAYLGAWAAYSIFEEPEKDESESTDALSFKILPDRIKLTYRF